MDTVLIGPTSHWSSCLPPSRRGTVFPKCFRALPSVVLTSCWPLRASCPQIPTLFNPSLALPPLHYY